MSDEQSNIKNSDLQELSNIINELQGTDQVKKNVVTMVIKGMNQPKSILHEYLLTFTNQHKWIEGVIQSLDIEDNNKSFEPKNKKIKQTPTITNELFVDEITNIDEILNPPIKLYFFRLMDKQTYFKLTECYFTDEKFKELEDKINFKENQIVVGMELEEEKYALLYEKLQCNKCGLRFKDNEKKRREFELHLDEHNRMQRIRELNETISREYFLEDKNGEERKRINLPEIKKVNEKIRAKAGNMCNVCFEKLDIKWDDELDDWIYVDAIEGSKDEFAHQKCLI